MSDSNRIIVGITGASGAIYAKRCIELLLRAERHVHLVVSAPGQRLLHDELGMEGVDAAALAAPERPDRLILHNIRDVGASIASGSFPCGGMLVVPCSSSSLAAVAGGLQQTLIHRAAAVSLKERRRLILVHREAPLAMTDIRNMQLATEAGAVICPASPGFYLMPRSIDDLVDFVVARVLDLLEIPHELQRWGQNLPSSSEPLTP